MAKSLKVNEGDWICGEKSCGNINFSWRDKCNKCGKSKGKVDVFKKAGNEIGRQLATKSGGLFSAEDWQCPMCGNVNWARRNECNVCKQPKFSKVEARTGAGGGYCDRDNVEYIDRRDSDDEIDDFGRKKKQFRLSSKSGNDFKTKDRKTKEEKNGTLSNYNVTGSNEEEDSDNDEDVDLSKYDLIVSDEEETQVKSNSPHKRSRSHSRSRSSSPKRRRHSYRSRSRSRSLDRRKRSRSRSYERGRGHKRAHSRSRSRSHERKRRSKEHRRSHRSRSHSRDRR